MSYSSKNKAMIFLLVLNQNFSAINIIEMVSSKERCIQRAYMIYLAIEG